MDDMADGSRPPAGAFPVPEPALAIDVHGIEIEDLDKEGDEGDAHDRKTNNNLSGKHLSVR